MTRMRIEGLLAAFPKLIGTGKQHTYVETENVRYVYQPMEALYLLLITNKQSNILEDLDTLRILSKLENVTVAQVKQYCEMESHEEKLHRQMREDKIREAKDEMKRKANEIDKNKIGYSKVDILCSESGKQRIILMDQESQEASILPSSLRNSRKNEAIHKLGC
nr:coatomer subunit delta-2 isoform X2 [Arachis hypogaea]